MWRTVEATYEGGVLHPLEPLLLRERQRVTVTVFDDIDLPSGHSFLVSPDECADAAGEDIALEEVRHRLSGIQGSLAQVIVDERRDR
jgi:predicted DNA-binding antitoxin AbrB/MazE fold protein